MSPEEAIKLCRLVKAACPSQVFDQYTPDAWHLILGWVNFEDAKLAIQCLAGMDLDPGKSRYIEPGHIIAQVRRIRAKRIDDHGPIDPPSGIEPAAYLVWLRDTTKAIADGKAPARPALPPADPARASAIVNHILANLPSIEAV